MCALLHYSPALFLHSCLLLPGHHLTNIHTIRSAVRKSNLRVDPTKRGLWPIGKNTSSHRERMWCKQYTASARARHATFFSRVPSMVQGPCSRLKAAALCHHHLIRALPMRFASQLKVMVHPALLVHSLP